MGDPQRWRRDPALPLHAALDLQAVSDGLADGTLQRSEVAAEMAQDASAGVLTRLAARARQRGQERPS